ncbi:zinc-regulated transporter 2 [Purpureocillium lavendulum]|uniref:Zinc-regulated transporter 2 n=1 Tax=Purpureocillium lavendulum TaxID=1247861 RepID=A0AB34FD02_9HYPO|nr:zinc-regulated transporter 2 [Purpureocillium lavendulum]
MASQVLNSPSKTAHLIDVIKLFDEVELADSPETKLVDTVEAIAELVGLLEGLPTEPPSLYFDLEGVNLSRVGTVSILQLHILPSKQTYLIDIHSLHDKSFSTPGGNGCTLKKILELDTIPKVFFDVRNDSDALYSHFGIRLAGVQDLQLMELASRSFLRKNVNGLAKCIERDAPLSAEERANWIRIKEKGVRLFAPEKGGTYEVFNERPLPADIVLYCAQDVQILPRLWAQYYRKLSSGWKKKVLEASGDRVKLSQSATYNGKGRHMALAPRGWH